MAAAWAQAKLERAQRSYNEPSRGWDSPIAREAWWGKLLDGE